MIKKAGIQLKGVPDIPVLHSLLAKAVQKPGDVQTVSWRNPDAQLLVLDVVCPHKERVPHWQIFLDKLGRRSMLGECYGHDTLMVFKSVSAAAASCPATDNKLEENSRAARAREARAKTLNSLPIGNTVDQSKPKEDFDAKSVYLQRVTEISDNPGQARNPGDFWVESGVVINDFFTDGPPAVQPSDGWQSNSSSRLAALVDSDQDSAAALAAEEARKKAEEQAAAAARAAQEAADLRKARQAVQAARKATHTDLASQPSMAGQAAAAQLSGQSNLASGPASAPAAPGQATGQSQSSGAGQAGRTPTEGAQAEVARRIEPKPIEVNKAVSGGRIDTSQLVEAKNNQSRREEAPKVEAQKPEFKKPEDKKPEAQQADAVESQAEVARKKYPSRGSLDEFPIKKLFRILKEEHFAGRVRFEDDDQMAIVFMVDGFPVECAHGELRGDAALMELLLWSSGTFKVTPNIEPRARNVNTTVEILIDQNRHLTKLLQEMAEMGLTATSTFVPSNTKLGRDEFFAIASEDAPFNLETLGNLYLQLDGLKTLSDLAKLQLLARPLLVRGLHHLAMCELIKIMEPPKGTRKPVIQPKNIDGSAIHSVMMSLRRSDTGLFIYPAFLYFLEEEFFRIYRARGTMSLLLFEMRELVETPDGFKRKPISTEAVSDAVMRIFKRKRHTDILGHYEAFDFAALLPGTKPGGASVFAQKLYKSLMERPLAGMEGKRLSLVFGASGIPEDCTDVNTLLASAEFALNFARDHGKPFAMYGDILV